LKSLSFDKFLEINVSNDSSIVCDDKISGKHINKEIL
jgi:hypothetical protein